MRWAAWVGLFLFGCAREAFGHTGRATLGAGAHAGWHAGPGAVDCETAEPGTRCDDDNVCTPASTCRDGQCLAGTSSRECLVTDNGDRAEDEQGGDGWYYGFWNAGQD